jgi:hypothetical protein
MSMGSPVTNARSIIMDSPFTHLDTACLMHLNSNMVSPTSVTNVTSIIMDSLFGHLDTDFLMPLYSNMSMGSPLIKVPLTTMDSSIAHLDASSALTVPKIQARVQPSANGAGPSTGGFCMTPERGLDRRSLSQLRGLSRRTQSQRYLVGFSACMVDTPDMTIQEMFDVPVLKDQNRTSAAAKLVDHILHELEAQLQIKEKECVELRELVDSCSRGLPRIIMVGRKGG